MSDLKAAAPPGSAPRRQSWNIGSLVGSLVILAGFALAAAIPLQQWIPVPFGFAFLAAAALTMVLAFLGRRRPWVSNIFMVAFALSLGLAVTEFFFAWQASAKPTHVLKDAGSFTNGYFNPEDPDLGYSPYPDKVVEHLRSAGDDPVFQARYTIGPGAFRVTPGNPKSSETDVFFGDSFTFGEGLNDDQTLPAQYSKARDFQTNVVNLGFHGYGPHQMLRALQTGRFDKYLTHVKHVFYQTIGYHTERVTGLAAWDPNGPRYLLDDRTGAPVFTGKYSDFPTRLFDRAHPVLYRSFIVRKLVATYGFRASAADIDLIVGIFAESARLVRKKYGADFTLLVWDFDPHHNDPTGAKIADEAERRGLHVIRVSQIFPAPRTDFVKRYLIPIDGHPNARADEILGAALAKREH